MNNNRKSTLLLLLAAAAGITAAAMIAARGDDMPSLASPDTTMAPTAPRIAVSGEVAHPARTVVREANRHGVYTALVGTVLGFDSSLRSTTRFLNSAGRVAVEISHAITGRSEVVVAGRRDGEILIHVGFPGAGVIVTVGGQNGEANAIARLKRELASGCDVRMTETGQTAGYRFPTECSEEGRAHLRTLVATLRFVVPLDTEAVWSTEEADTTGRYECSYAWDNARLNKTEIRYLPSTGSPAPVTEARGVATFDREAGWLSNARFAQRTRLAIPSRTITGDLLVGCSLTDHKRTTVPSADWGGVWLPQTPEAVDDEILAAIEQQQRALAERTNFATVCAELKRLLASKNANPAASHDLARKLAALFRYRPEVLAELRVFVADPNTDRQLAATLIQATGSTDTKHTQAFLRDILTDAGFNSDMRLAATVATTNLDRPNAAVVGALAEVAASLHVPPALAGTGMLALGTFIHGRLDRTQTDATLKTLIGLEKVAASRGLAADWLEALGNAGADSAVNIASRYLRHDDAHLRLTALEAIRKVRSPNAVALLVNEASHDADPRVRLAAAEQLCARGGRQGLERIEAMLAHEDAFVRSRLIRALAGVPTAFATKLLERAANSDQAPHLRQLARKALEKRCYVAR